MSLRTMTLFFAAVLLAAVPALANKPFDRELELQPQRQDCNQQGASTLCLPLDSTWEVVPFDFYTAPCYINDDGSSLEIPLNFIFDLFGSAQTSCWVNNNGNISFDGPYSTYTPEGFPLAGFPMVAPFWGDVDTRSLEDGAGAVWMKQGPNYFAVTWDHVGYYSQHTDLQNTFQLIISDGTYEEMGLGNNVCFCYGDMNWTTGDASGGEGGFGGSPATVGVNKGDGIDFFNIGQFDHPGSDYAGPDGISGVDWLDGRSFCFNTAAEFNQPPVAINFPAGNVVSVTEIPWMLTVGFIGPEGDQTVHTDVDDGGLANFSWVSNDGNPSTVEMTFNPDEAQIGQHVIHFTATDSYDPPGVTEVDLIIIVDEEVPNEGSTWGTVKTMYR